MHFRKAGEEMVFTSSYDAFNLQNAGYNFCSISGDRGKMAGFNGEYYHELAPKLGFWKIWHKNIGEIPDYDNNQFYIQEYWKQVISLLDPDKIYNKLVSPSTVLLCYERHNDFCHRHIVSAWLELSTGKEVQEVAQEKSGQLIVTSRPLWVKDYLQKIMQKN